MANSKYAYVKSFEVEERILPEVWIVVRLDGRCFSRFAEEHRLQKPNDERCLRLMEHSARKVLESFDDCFLAYGQSDEFSFVLRKQTNIFNRRKRYASWNLCRIKRDSSLQQQDIIVRRFFVFFFFRVSLENIFRRYRVAISAYLWRSRGCISFRTNSSRLS
jgi:hypothetical protein